MATEAATCTLVVTDKTNIILVEKPLLSATASQLAAAHGTTLSLRMAKSKKTSIVIRLMSMAGTGYFYTRRKNIKANPEKCASAGGHIEPQSSTP